jgi:hypothetical protein
MVKDAIAADQKTTTEIGTPWSNPAHASPVRPHFIQPSPITISTYLGEVTARQHGAVYQRCHLSTSHRSA